MRPASEGRRDRHLVTGLVLAACGVLAIAAGLVLGGGAALATPGASCHAAKGGVTVHFELALLNRPDPGISTVVLRGFDPGSCDGQPATVTLSGNRAGDPTAPATNLLSTLDSSSNPCTGEALTSPVVIRNGAITLAGCARTHDADHAAYARVHDVTRLTLKIAGHELPTQPGGSVLAPQAPSSGSHASTGHGQVSAPVVGNSNSGATASTLPNTGGPGEIILLVGIVLLLFGAATVWSRSRADPGKE